MVLECALKDLPGSTLWWMDKKSDSIEIRELWKKTERIRVRKDGGRIGKGHAS